MEHGRHLCWMGVIALLIWNCPTSYADRSPGGNLLGHRGLLRIASATNHPSGWVGIGTDFQYFAIGDFLSKGENHSRMINTFSLLWTPIKYIEAAIAIHVTSDSSTEGEKEDLMVTVGDPEISIKGGYKLLSGLSAGLLFDLRFLSGSGLFQSAISSTSFLLALLGSYSIGTNIPLSIHLNLGFYYDGSEKLFDDTLKLNQAQLFAAQVSSFNRIVTRVGLEYVTTYVGPFIELSLEPYVGSDAPGFGDSPGVISLGVKVWPTKSKGFQFMAGLDIGITGVSGGQVSSGLPTGKYAFSISRWNLLLRLSYRFDAYGKEEDSRRKTHKLDNATNIKPARPQRASISGVVVNVKTNKPVWNARISVEGEETSSLVVNVSDGTFKTFKLPLGKQTLIANADGYTEKKTMVDLKATGSQVTIQLTPKATAIPGTIRGTVKALEGQNPTQATILIPMLDRTITVGRNGAFSIALKPGEYKLVISARNFRTQHKTIRVWEGATVILNVELHK